MNLANFVSSSRLSEDGYLVSNGKYNWKAFTKRLKIIPLELESNTQEVIEKIVKYVNSKSNPCRCGDIKKAVNIHSSHKFVTIMSVINRMEKPPISRFRLYRKRYLYMSHKLYGEYIKEHAPHVPKENLKEES